MSRSAWLATAFASSLAVSGCSGALSPTETSAEDGDAAPRDAQPSGHDAAQVSPARDALADAVPFEAGSADAGIEEDAEAGWHTCYGAPPSRREPRPSLRAAGCQVVT